MSGKDEKVMRLERYAEVLAHVVYFRGEDLHEVLARLGVTPEDWARADAEHTAELALSAKRNQGIQALRFSSVFARTRRSLEAKRPSLASLGLRQQPATENTAPAPLPRAPATPQQPAFTVPRSPAERDAISPWAANARALSTGDRGWTPPRAEAAPASPISPDRAAIPLNTADISELVPRRDLPFQDAHAQTTRPSAPERKGKRLQRFDPQTGTPLDPPVWVDAPPAPDEEGSG